MLGRLPNMINITDIKLTTIANISSMVLKVKYAVKRDTNIPGIFRWESHGAITKCNRWKMIRGSVLSLFDLS